MKKILIMLLDLTMALTAIARSFTYEYNGQTLTYYVIDEDGKTCKTQFGRGSTAGNKVSGKLTIPSEASDGTYTYTVTELGNSSFYNCDGLTSVTIPNSVQTIGDLTFYGCRGLTSVTIGNSVQIIGNSVFSYCDRLTSVTIPNSVQTIGETAFYGCNGLTSVTIPNSVISIGERAFDACLGLTSVTIGNSVQTIGKSAFDGCDRLTSVTIGNSVQTIGESAFASCRGLTSVTIPNSVQTIGDSAFYDCGGLKEVNYNTSKPVAGNKWIFSDITYMAATLNVADGGLEKAYITSPWMHFVNIQEKNFSSIEEVIANIDGTTPVEVYNLSGVKVADTAEGLPTGIYIFHQGSKVEKIAVK